MVAYYVESYWLNTGMGPTTPQEAAAFADSVLGPAIRNQQETFQNLSPAEQRQILNSNGQQHVTIDSASNPRDSESAATTMTQNGRTGTWSSKGVNVAATPSS